MRNFHLPTEKTKKRRIIFFELGMILALSFTLWAFNISHRTSDAISVITTSGADDPFTPLYITPPIEEPQTNNNVTTEENAQPIKDRFRIVSNITPIPTPTPAPIP